MSKIRAIFHQRGRSLHNSLSKASWNTICWNDVFFTVLAAAYDHFPPTYQFCVNAFRSLLVKVKVHEDIEINLNDSFLHFNSKANLNQNVLKSKPA